MDWRFALYGVTAIFTTAWVVLAVDMVRRFID